MTSKPPRVNNRDARRYLQNFEEFRGSNFHAREYPQGCGYISPGWAGQQSPPQGCTYVVFSYDTPIAWVENCGRAVISSEHHSVSTARHRSYCYALRDRANGDRAEIARRNQAEEVQRAQQEEARRRAQEQERAVRAKLAGAERARRNEERRVQKAVVAALTEQVGQFLSTRPTSPTLTQSQTLTSPTPENGNI